MLNALRRGLLIALACLPLFSHAAASSPNEVIESTTTQLLDNLKANKEQYRKDSSAFYSYLDGLLGPVVDAEGISRSIMTVKYSRGASPEQMKRFEENFKRSLFQFYGNALLEYNNEVIRVLPASGKQPEPDRASVKMEVVGKHGEVYPVEYTMVKQDQWRVRNVIINGINIGKLFRDQFEESMNRNGGDLDKTINGWGDVVAKAKDTAAAEKATAK